MAFMEKRNFDHVKVRDYIVLFCAGKYRGFEANYEGAEEIVGGNGLEVNNLCKRVLDQVVRYRRSLSSNTLASRGGWKWKLFCKFSCNVSMLVFLQLILLLDTKAKA